MNNLIKHKKTLILFVGLMILSIITLQIIGFFVTTDSLSQEIIKNSTIRIVAGTFLVIILYSLGYHLFKKPSKSPTMILFIIIPGLLIAFNNFPISAFFNGRTVINELHHVIYLFAIECLSIGLLEETAFRGVILIILMQRLPKNKRGYLTAILISSLIFGAAHLLNLFNGLSLTNTLLQIGYSFLMGALWSVVFISTENLIFPIMLHASFNFFGLVLFRIGSVSNRFDTVTIISTTVLAIVSLFFYIFIFVSKTSKEIERALHLDLS